MAEKYTSREDLEYFRNHIVEENFSELMSLIDEFSDYKFDEDALILNNNYDIGEKGKANKGFSRLFYNYITSSFSLIDQMENFSDEVEGKKNDIFSDGQIKFLKELRNFLTHKTKPPIDSKEVGAEVLQWKKRKFELLLDKGFLKYLDRENRSREEEIRKYLDGRTVLGAESELRSYHNSLNELYRQLKK